MTLTAASVTPMITPFIACDPPSLPLFIRDSRTSSPTFILCAARGLSWFQRFTSRTLALPNRLFCTWRICRCRIDTPRAWHSSAVFEPIVFSISRRSASRSSWSSERCSWKERCFPMGDDASVAAGKERQGRPGCRIAADAPQAGRGDAPARLAPERNSRRLGGTRGGGGMFAVRVRVRVGGGRRAQG